jgi:hypothetical protein
MLEKWGFRMSKINTIDGDSVELTRIQQELQGKNSNKDVCKMNLKMME